jgi:hypothetical protein
VSVTFRIYGGRALTQEERSSIHRASPWASTTPARQNKRVHNKISRIIYAFLLSINEEKLQDLILGTLQLKGVVKRYHTSRERERIFTFTGLSYSVLV